MLLSFPFIYFFELDHLVSRSKQRYTIQLTAYDAS